MASVPYLLMLSVFKYFKIMFPNTTDSSVPANSNYENAQMAREELLFVRSLIASIFIAIVITHMIDHVLNAVLHGQLDLPLSIVGLALLIVLIFYYVQIEKALPPNINTKPKRQ